jgi:hypothetical protein
MSSCLRTSSRAMLPGKRIRCELTRWCDLPYEHVCVSFGSGAQAEKDRLIASGWKEGGTYGALVNLETGTWDDSHAGTTFSRPLRIRSLRRGREGRKSAKQI